MPHKIFILIPALTLAIIGCQNNEDLLADHSNNPLSEATDQGRLQQKVIYGVDDRLDYYQIASSTWKGLARSTVALFFDYTLQPPSSPWNPNEKLDMSLHSYQDSYSLCSTERFHDQSTGAFCSGSLIGPDLIMTAGHCVEDQRSCEETAFVFDFRYDNAKTPPTTAKAGNVYRCKKLVRSQVDSGRGADFAIVQLDRKVTGRKPLAYRTKGEVQNGESLAIIGHPAGLPLKMAGGAKVRNTIFDKFFVASLDSYGGNSGSAVFNVKTKKVEGILVRGEMDYVYKGPCRVSHRCTDDGCEGEDVTRVRRVLPYLDKIQSK